MLLINPSNSHGALVINNLVLVYGHGLEYGIYSTYLGRIPSYRKLHTQARPTFLEDGRSPSWFMRYINMKALEPGMKRCRIVP